MRSEFEPEPEYIDERRWERIETLGEGYSPRTGHTVVAYGATLYVFGGTDRRRRQQDLFQFDIDSCMWSQVDVHGSLPPRRSGALGVVHENNMYIFGGYDGRDGNYFNDLFFFNFETRRWSEMPNQALVRPESRTDHIMVLHDSNIYIFGGYNGSSRFNNMYRYELDAKLWRKMEVTGAIPSGRFGHSGAVHEPSKRLIIFGGWDGRDTLDDLYEYAFETGVWSIVKTTGKSPPHRYRHTAVIYGDSMFVFGGVDKAHSRFNDLQRLDLVTNTWSEVYTSGYVPSSRTFHRAVVVSNRMYLLGGYDGTDRLHDLYSIHPPSRATTSTKYSSFNPFEACLKVRAASMTVTPLIHVEDVLGQIIFRRDADNELRGRCTACRDGRCGLYKLSRMPPPEAPVRHLRSRDRAAPKQLDNALPCVCGHGNGLHELIDERRLFGERPPLHDANGKSKVLQLYQLYKRIFNGPVPPASEHHQASSA
ncbi:hypothetical protein ACHHYP_02026 [Achlya hypogyna]|uniref:Attractin/MKLN-like beta-propeller domain-containing protein n=1 Tax=Achlya hypogyna TaxID=1202772 RepID=A0A1V9ZSL9_ACHHY|nr:hypothetical protein ACHHYP_02026 [Achlya hypogyna]